MSILREKLWKLCVFRPVFTYKIPKLPPKKVQPMTYLSPPPLRALGRKNILYTYAGRQEHWGRKYYEISVEQENETRSATF